MHPPDALATDSSADDRAGWFRDQVAPHGGQLRAYLRGSFPAVRDVDDVVQDSFLQIWQARSAQPINSAKAFLFTIARRLATKTVLRQRRSPLGEMNAESEGVADAAPDPADLLTYEERVAMLCEAIVALPERCREVVMLRKLHGMPQKEVAARLHISEKTVENHLAAGMDRCERYFRSRGISSLR